MDRVQRAPERLVEDVADPRPAAQLSSLDISEDQDQDQDQDQDIEKAVSLLPGRAVERCHVRTGELSDDL